MFTVGAEFDPGLLRGQRGVIGAASLSMMAVPFALGVTVAMPLLGHEVASGRLPIAGELGFVIVHLALRQRVVGERLPLRRRRIRAAAQG
jgi:hypothetical protein